jgi:dolichyl-diphosphooligosaccharide--protein glycosyltransferase
MPQQTRLLPRLIAWAIRLYIIRLAIISSYEIRLFAIKSYGLVIHEFDPWFNFRATQYLADNGWTAFFQWFDHRSWYPLGRPVGTTIYPGMQIVSVCLWKIFEYIGHPMSLNDVCCYVPAWFGAIATSCLGLLTWECTGSPNAGVIAMCIMAIIPAHIMRSVGGGYDNESVAMTAMLLTFLLWNRSIRAPYSKFFAVLAGFAYIFMVAAWGGYIFVINMVGIHAALLVVLGHFNDDIYWSYTIFYVLGTFGATRVPVVGWAPLKSLEQLAPCGVFIVYQAFQLCEVQRKNLKVSFNSAAAWKIRVRVFGAVATVGAVVVAMLFPTGYFGPLSSRVRGLFVKHTRTGNPLVDSVAEHQPASEQAYRTYLHHTYNIAPYGFALSLIYSRSSARFISLWTCVVFFFANKMMRLVLLAGPVTSALSGLLIGALVDWCLEQFSDFAMFKVEKTNEPSTVTSPSSSSSAGGGKKSKKGKSDSSSSKSSSSSSKAKDDDDDILKPFKDAMSSLHAAAVKIYDHSSVKAVRKIVAVVMALGLLVAGKQFGQEFWDYSHQMAEQLSSPSIMFHAQLRDGTTITVDDYREAYWWLRDNTPDDARVMAWWDYGYQISGIANRTTIADGNTWNHEHIATLGRCLTAPEKDAHRIVRHLADYVLIWTGGGGDDLAKSPHMARIGNSVFSDICPGDPTCSQFGFYQGGIPTPMMEKSLLYKLHSHLMKPGVSVNQELFKEVYRSKYGKVRIYQVLKVSKESKNWVADPSNRICDAPGSWYCVGQYPPALSKLIARRKNFAQLEDFNSNNKNSEYTREYMARMNGEKPPPGQSSQQDSSDDDKKSVKAQDGDKPPLKIKRRSKKWAEAIPWENNEQTTLMYQLLENNDLKTLEKWLSTSPDSVHIRSEDGRGPLWWAKEFGNNDAVNLLKHFKVREDLVDASGNKP